MRLLIRAGLVASLAVSPAIGANTTLPQKAAKLIIKVTQGKQLWYFGGQPKPASFTDGDTEVTLTAVGKTQGTFRWDVTAGADKATLEGDVTSIAKSNDNAVKLASKKASGATPGDVSIRLTYGTGKATRKLEVRAPQRFTPVRAADAGAGFACTVDGSAGWRSGIVYILRNQYGEPVRNLSVNETIGQKTSVEANNWPVPGPFGTVTDGVGEFFDLLCVTGISFTPQPEAPNSPLSSRLIDKVAQSWFAGSGTPGSGIRVQTNNASRFIDHGRHTEITSPAP